jgi:hypothetical protein
MNELVKLPLWKNCLEAMLAEGIEHGRTYTAEFFEEQLQEKRDTMQFSLAISAIRRELEKYGFYLSGRGQKGTQFIILPPENNADVMLSYQSSALDALKRGVILGTQTRLDTLAETDRRRHEKILERIAIRSVLMNRSRTVVKTLGEKAQKVLKQ